MADNRRHSGLRARDADRVDACALLDAARAEGELTEAEHAQRTAKAMQARTFGDIDALIGDLQIPRNLANAPVVRADRRDPKRRWWTAAALVLVAALAGSISGCIARNAGSAPPIPDPTTGPGIASFLAAYKHRYGDLMVDEMGLYPRYVLVDRAAADPNRLEDIHYNEKGFLISDSSRSRDAESFDLAELDVPTLARVIAGAPETLKVPGGKITHISIDRDSSSEVPTATVYVDNGDRSGHLELTLSGEPIAVYPSDD